ncbi:MAG: hypothetical protein U0V75_01345 [Ferruginibacter sp.]
MKKIYTYITNSPVKFLLLKASVFLLTLYIADFVTGKILRHYYFRQGSGLQYRTTYTVEKNTSDILVFGASRANHHYHPGVFKEELPSYSFYNAGRDGNSIFYHYAVLKMVLGRYTPKIVILDMENGSLVKNNESYDRISSLLPYYESHPEIRSVIELRSRYEKYKLFSKTYPYNSSIFTIAIGNSEMNKARWKDINGYLPLSNVLTAAIGNDSNTVNNKNPLDSNKINCYENFLKDCVAKGVKVFVYVSPYFLQFSTPDKSVMKAKEIAQKYDVTFSDYSSDTFFTERNFLFADIVHLNDSGAKIYSSKIMPGIKSVLAMK